MFSDARLIAATNQDLALAIGENRFRPDLFYRLNVIHLHLAPLRERPEDLAVLIDYFLDFYRRQFRKPELDFSADARRKLESCAFPGNVRELKNIIERAAAISLGDCIESDQIFFHKSAADENNNGSNAPEKRAAAILPPDFNFASDNSVVELAELERRYILAILAYTNGNRERAAALLGVSERTLYRRLREFNDEFNG